MAPKNSSRGETVFRRIAALLCAAVCTGVVIGILRAGWETPALMSSPGFIIPILFSGAAAIGFGIMAVLLDD